MARPCFLVVDREYVGSISTRKLVIETAKLNVITAYSAVEALDLLERFPRVDGIIVDAGLPDMRCEELIRQLKALQPKLPIVVIGTPRPVRCEGADAYLDAFEPTQLLGTLRHLVPEAQAVLDQERKVSEGDSAGMGTGLVG